MKNFPRTLCIIYFSPLARLGSSRPKLVSKTRERERSGNEIAARKVIFWHYFPYGRGKVGCCFKQHSNGEPFGLHSAKSASLQSHTYIKFFIINVGFYLWWGHAGLWMLIVSSISIIYRALTVLLNSKISLKLIPTMQNYATPAWLTHRCPLTSCPFFPWNAQQWIKCHVSVGCGDNSEKTSNFIVSDKACSVNEWLSGVNEIQRRVVALSVSFTRDLPGGVTFCPHPVWVITQAQCFTLVLCEMYYLILKLNLILLWFSALALIC